MLTPFLYMHKKSLGKYGCSFGSSHFKYYKKVLNSTLSQLGVQCLQFTYGLRICIRRVESKQYRLLSNTSNSNSTLSLPNHPFIITSNQHRQRLPTSFFLLLLPTNYLSVYHSHFIIIHVSYFYVSC